MVLLWIFNSGDFPLWFGTCTGTTPASWSDYTTYASAVFAAAEKAKADGKNVLLLKMPVRGMLRALAEQDLDNTWRNRQKILLNAYEKGEAIRVDLESISGRRMRTDLTPAALPV